MDKQQAREIIKDTFESSFDKDKFTRFIRNLLNRIDDSLFTYQGNSIPDAYKQYIKKLEHIGNFSDGENSIDILVITLQKETSLERARTMQRNFIAWYLYEGLKHGWVESKIRDDAYQANLAADSKKFPKRSRTQPEYQEVDENDATRTNEERNRQLQQLALAE